MDKQNKGMKKEYTVSILVDPALATKHGILHESEAVEEQIREAITYSLNKDFLYKDMGIEVLTVYPTKAVRYRRTKAEIELDKSIEKFHNGWLK